MKPDKKKETQKLRLEKKSISKLNNHILQNVNAGNAAETNTFTLPQPTTLTIIITQTLIGGSNCGTLL